MEDPNEECRQEIVEHIAQCGVHNLFDFLTTSVGKLGEEPLNVAVVRGCDSYSPPHLDNSVDNGGYTFSQSPQCDSIMNLFKAIVKALERHTLASQYASSSSFATLSQNASSLFLETKSNRGDLDKEDSLIKVERTIVITEDHFRRGQTDTKESFEFSTESTVVSVDDANEDVNERLPSPPAIFVFGKEENTGTPGSNGESLESELDEGIFINDLTNSELHVNQLNTISNNTVFVTENIFYLDTNFGVRLWSIPGEVIKSKDCEHLRKRMEAYLISTDSTKPLADDELKIAKELSKERNVVFLCYGFENAMEESTIERANMYRKMRSEYRKALFENSLWAMPLFVVCPPDTENFDMPDLCKTLGKWHKRILRCRKGIITEAVQDSFTAKTVLPGLICSVVPVVCGLALACSPRLPIGCISGVSGDILMAGLSYFVYSKHYGIQAKELVYLEESKEETTSTEKSSLMSMLFSHHKHVSCTLLWCLGYGAKVAAAAILQERTFFQIAANVASSVIIGGLTVALTKSIIQVAMNDAHKDAGAIVKDTLEVKVPNYIRQYGESITTRANTRAGTPPLLFRKPSKPGLAGAISSNTLNVPP